MRMQRANKKPTSPLLLFGRIICLLFLVVSLGFVFLNSLENGVSSGKRSKEILVVINYILENVGVNPITHKVLRKMAHFGEFILVGFWISMCMRAFTARILVHLSFPLFWGLFISVCDEAIQLCIPGRVSSVIDVLIDFSGILAGTTVAFSICMIFAIVSFIAKKRRRKKTQDNFFYWG